MLQFLGLKSKYTCKPTYMCSLHPKFITPYFFIFFIFYMHWAILKNVGGNPSCCNLEAPLEKFFQVFLRFTKIYFNGNH